MQLMIPDPLNSKKMIPVLPEEHPLNKEATEILLALENLEPEQEDQLVLEHSHLPILELIERVVGIEGLGMTHPGLPEKWFKLQEMPAAQAMRLLGGPYQENSIQQTQGQLEHLTEDPLGGLMLHPKPERWTQIEWTHQDLKRDLINLLEGVTPDQQALYDEFLENLAREYIADLQALENLNAFDTELLNALTAEQRTTEQQALCDEFLENLAREYIADLQALENLNAFDTLLLDAFTVLTQETTPEPTGESAITPDAGTMSASETISDTNPVQKKAVHYSEDQIKDIAAHYFESLSTASSGYSVKREHLIQMGSDRRRADVVFLRNGKLVVIAECKRTGRVEKGNQQLHSYLCATDTFLGIFANDGDPNKWTFWENHRCNNFLEIDRKTFENYIYNHDKAIQNREQKIKQEIEREIDAEIRKRVRKNTDTNAIRQDEMSRIKQKTVKNIDKTAIVNSVRSQIEKQAENGLLNKRDEENRKHGRSQGFWWTVLSIIGIGILIALLTSAT